jgi:secreted protein with Ig-like and vWFA domain
MSAANENHEPVQLDDLHDRLLDTALAEVTGQRVPPDLSGRITAAHEATLATRPEISASGWRLHHFKWMGVAVAATLLIGIALLFAQSTLNTRQLARNAAPVTEVHSGFQSLGDRLHGIASSPLQDETASIADLAESTIHTDTWAAKTPINGPTSSNLSLSPSQTQSVPQTSFGTPATTTVTTGTLALDPMARGGGAKLGSQPPAPTGGPSPVALDFAYPIQAPDAEAAESSPAFPNFTSDLNTPFRQGSFNVQKSESEKLHQTADRYSKSIDTPSLQTPTNSTLSDDLATLADPSTKARGVNGPGFGALRQKAHNSPQAGPEGAGGTTPLVTSAERAPVQSFAYTDEKTISINMSVTPRIIVQEDEEELLGLHKESLVAEGTGPGASGDKYTPINENPFIKTVGPDAVSTFSIDVDTASYSNVRQFLTQMNQLPPPDAVRIEELVNYFQYDYTPPKADDEAPFAAHVEVASCPWNAEHRLARIAVKGRELDRTKRPQSNLVFLVDVSGSMNEPAKLPLVVYGLEQLTKELGENDHIAIVVYASSEGLVLPSTSGTKQDTILAALGKLQAGGSTAGGAGINLAYQIAEDNFIKGGTNRVILCTDGDFNVGVTSTGDLQTLVEKKAKDTGVFLSVLGFGRGNLNDAMMEAISGHGNGNYHYVDNRKESRRVLVEEMTGTLVTIAKDVKIQVEFNPTQVAGYRLIGYEDRMLRTEDFNDDKKDAGEIGAGHTVTAMYELIPAGKKVDIAPVDDLKYQKKEEAEFITRPVRPEEKELLTLKMRYKAPDGDTSKKLEWPITDAGKAFGEATDDFQFASAVAGFGLLLRNSQYKGNLTYAADLELAQGGVGADKDGYRAEFVEMVQKAKTLKKE